MLFGKAQNELNLFVPVAPVVPAGRLPEFVSNAPLAKDPGKPDIDFEK